MSILDKLFGHHDQPQQPGQNPQQQQPPQSFTGPAQPSGYPEQAANPNQINDEQAIERYKYMLRTAPPEAIEEAHAEAFAKLTPQQRQMVLAQLSQAVPQSEVAHANADDPRNLARVATRAEMREPGLMQRILGGGAGMMGGGGYGAPGYGSSGPGFGTILGASLLGNLAAEAIGSVVARHFFSSSPVGQAFFNPGMPGYGQPLVIENYPSDYHKDRDDDDDSSNDNSSDDSSSDDSSDQSGDTSDDDSDDNSNDDSSNDFADATDDAGDFSDSGYDDGGSSGGDDSV